MDNLSRPAPGDLAHFAVNADDVDRARVFYAAVFGWTFEPWGPPGFYSVRTAAGVSPGPIGALQPRRELLPGIPQHGFECTVAVTDVGACLAAAEAAGGRVLMRPTVLAGVGELAFVCDPEGNVCGLMRYDPDAD